MQKEFFSPPKILVMSFLITAVLGTLALTAPWSVKDGTPDFITAMFTAVSSLCVTGLVTVDTASHWTIYGQIVILLLIQIGGLGVMTLATFLVLVLGRRLNLKHKILMQFALDRNSMENMIIIFRYLLVFALAAESLGALILFLHWLPDMGAGKAAWFALFHSVSAFNNAGFDLFGNFQSLQAFRGDWVVNLTISILFIIGSLGFLVIYELIRYKDTGYLSLHARLVLIGTGVILVLGTAIILLLESSHTLAALPWSEKLLASYFLSATRTAGFTTIDLGTTILPTRLFLMGLMFIGGAPGSTAGGVKVTTFLLIILTVWSVFANKKDVEISHRRIDPYDVFRAITVAIISMLVIFTFTLLLSLQHQDLTKVLFEVISATGTVGLSLGLTPQLTVFGKCLIMIIMFFGRLGPITIGLAMADRPQRASIRYPEDHIMIG